MKTTAASSVVRCFANLYLLIALLLCFCHPAKAAIVNWNGGGTDGYWQTAANWSAAPVASDILQFGVVGTRPINTNNFAAGTVFGGIAFSNTSTSFTLRGNDITLGGGITNNSLPGPVHTVNPNLILNGDRLIQFNTNGTLTFNGVITNDGTARTLTIQSIVRNSPPTNIFNAKNNWGNTVLTVGGARFLKVVNGVNDALPTNGSLTLNSGSNGRPTWELNGFNQIIQGLARGSGGPMTVNSSSGTPTLTINTPPSTVFEYWGVNDDLTGSLSLVKTGSGTQILALTAAGSTMTYSGSTRVLGGYLMLGVTFASAGQVSVTNAVLMVETNKYLTLRNLAGDSTATVDLFGGSLTNNSTANSEFAGSITNTGNITKFGSSTWTLSGANTFTGSTFVNAGTLALNHVNALQNSTYYGGAGALTLAVAGDNAYNFGGLAGAITINGNNTLRLGANNSSSTCNGVISGSGNFEKAGSGTVTVTSTNLYSGATVVSGGSLVLQAPTGATSLVSNSASIVVSSGATLDVSQVADGFIFGSSKTMSGSGVVTGNVTVVSSTIYPGGSGTVGTLSFSNNLVLGGGGLSFEVTNNTGNADLINVLGNVTGSGTISVAVAGPVLANGAYILVHSAGTMDFSAATISQPSSPFGKNYAVSQSGSDLVLTVTDASRQLSWGGQTDGNWNYSTVNWTNSISLAPVTFLDGDPVTFDDGGLAQPVVNLTATVLPVTTTVNSSGNYTFVGVGGIGGTNILTKNGIGTLTMSVSNSYSGATTINGGTLSVTNDDALGVAPGAATPNSLVLAGGALAVDGVTLNANRGIGLSGTGGTIQATGADSSYGGVIAGTAALTKSGSGQLTLTGVNSYSGNTTNAAGALVIGGAGQLGGGAYAGSIENAGTLKFNSSAAQTLSGAVSGAGSLTKNGNGTLTLNGANTYTGATTNNGGILSINADSRLGAAPGSPTAGHLELNGGALATTATFALNANRGISLGASGGTVSVASSTFLTNTAAIAGPGGLLNNGAGTLVMAAASSYSGGTTNAAGTLSLRHAGGLGSGDLTLSGGLLDVGADLVGGGVPNRVVLAVDSTLKCATNWSAIWNGVITNDGTPRTLTIATTDKGSANNRPTNIFMQKNGWGNTVLSGVGSSFWQAVENGTDDALPTFGTVTLTGGTSANQRWNLNGYNQTIAGLISGAAQMLVTSTNVNNPALVGVLTINTPAATDYTYAGVNHTMNGALAVVKTGAGRQQIGLTANVVNTTYTGHTWVLGGTLTMGAGFGGIGSMAVTNGVLQVESAASLTILNVLVGDATAAIDLNGGVLTNSFSAASCEFAGVITNAGNFVKEGSGSLTLSGANTYSGTTLVAGGTLLVKGSLGSGALTVNGGSTLAGGGSIGGTVTLASGATIAPGNGSVGTLTIGGDLNLFTNTLALEITNNTGNADKIVVTGNLNPSGTNIISFVNPAALPAGDYTLLEVTGALGGDASNFHAVSPTPVKTYTIEYVAGSPNTVVLHVVDTGASILNWTGDGGGNVWDVNAAVNWLNGLAPSVFHDNDLVSFDSIGVTNLSVNIVGTVSPASVVVDSSANYTLAGSGGISGTNGLTKNGTGILTLSNANTFTGAVQVNAGAVVAANDAALGASTGGVDVAANATLALVGGITVGAEALSINNDAGGTGIPAVLNVSGINTWGGNIAANTGTNSTRLNSDAGKLVVAGNITTAGTSGNLNVGGNGDCEISGIISGTQGFFKSSSGTGTCTLSGHNTYAGSTTVSRGALIYSGTLTNNAGFSVNNSKLTVSGSINSGIGGWTAGGSATNGVINIVSGATVVITNITIGATVAGGNGALNVSGGSLTLGNVTSTIGGIGGFGAFDLSGGAVAGYFIQLGSGSGGTGVAQVSGGTLTATDYLIVGRASTGVLTVGPGGIVNHANPTHSLSVAHATGSRGELNLVGGMLDNTGHVLVFGEGSGTNGVGIVNLNAGTLITSNLINADGTNLLNFSGGTLRAAYSRNPMIPSTLPVYVNGAFGSFAGGAVMDTAGFDDTIAAGLLAPVGNGVVSISVAGTQGSGYIGAPYVSIAGDGTGATAFANMVDDGSGNGTLKVGSVTISNPGNGYTSATVSFIGGTPTSAALGTVSIAANTSGGLVKLGAGSLTLSGASTYAGATVVSNGTLSVANVTGSGTGSGAVTVKSGGTLGGSGTISGAVTFESGSHALLAPGAPLTLSSALVVNGSADVHLSLPLNLALGNYTLATYSVGGSSGYFSATPVIDGGTLVANSYAVIVTSGGVVQLQVLPSTLSTTLSLESSVNPSVYGQMVTFTATVKTNGVAAGNATSNVVFSVGGSPVATNTVSGGQASYSTSALGLGTHAVGAQYLGDANYLGSTAPATNQVVTTVGTTTNITLNVTGSVVTLSWPASHLGWYVQSNAVDLASEVDWHKIDSTTNVTSYNVTADPAQPNVFYRLRSP